MNLRITISILLTVLTCAKSLAQKDDTGLWIGLSAEKKVTKKLSVEVEGEYRMKDNISATDRLSIGADASYKFTKWLKASAGYTYLHSKVEGGMTDSKVYYNSSFWYPRHRLHAGLTGSKKFGRWNMSLRERWVYTYRPSFMRNRMDMRADLASYGEVTQKERSGKAENVLRSKLGIEYNIRKSAITPYASVELYNAWAIEKIRYSVGAEYKFSKHHSAKLYYTFQDRKTDDDDDNQDQHVIGVQYGFSF